jgi:hypothetical protein
MTLNITILTRRAIYQSGDFRLLYTATGRWNDYTAQKQVLINRSSWSAVVAFAGVGETIQIKVTDWLAAQIAAIPYDADFRALIRALCSADSWLAPLRPRPAHTFSVGGFIGVKPVAALVSNFESIDGQRQPVRDRLFVTETRPGKPRIIVTGQPQAVPQEERRALLGLVRAKPEPTKVHEALADTNRRAAGRNNTISPGCFTSHLTLTGRGAGIPHGIDKDRDYIPAFSFGGMQIKLKPALDEHGKPKPIQLVQLATGRFDPSDEYF